MTSSSNIQRVKLPKGWYRIYDNHSAPCLPVWFKSFMPLAKVVRRHYDADGTLTIWWKHWGTDRELKQRKTPGWYKRKQTDGITHELF